MTELSTKQLEEGNEAFEQVLNSLAKHGSIPTNFHEMKHLLVEVQHPDGTHTIKKIGDLTAHDLRAYINSEDFKNTQGGTTNDHR